MTLTKDIAAKLSVAFVAVAMVFSAFASTASAQTTEDLQQMINDLLAQVATLQAQLGGDDVVAQGTCVSIAAPLTIGSQGADVTALQNALITAGQSIPAGATGYFGSQTQAALAAWQAANGVSPAVGYYGPITKAAMDAACTPATDDSDDMDDSDDSDDDSDMSLSGEGVLSTFEVDDDESEVQEGAEEVVMVLTLEATDGDVELSRLTFTLFDEDGTPTNNSEDDPWDVFETVSLWVDGDMIAEFEADDEDNYLDEDEGEFRFSDLGLILREDEEVEMEVAVEVTGSVDDAGTANLADWTLTPTQSRTFDADGVASTDDDIDEMGTGIDFEVVEEGTDDGADIESSSSNPDASTLLVDEETDESDEFVVHVFDIDVDNNSSDLEIGDAYVDVTVTNPTGNASTTMGDIIDSIFMTIDGETVEGDETDLLGVSNLVETDNGEIDHIIAATETNTVRFVFEFDQDVALEGGEEYEVEVSIVFEGQDSGSNFENGVIVSTDVNGITWEVEGLASDDELTGSDGSEDHTLATVVPVISDVSSSNERNDATTAGTISFEFTVAAEDEDDVTIGVVDNNNVNGLTDEVMFTLTGGAATSTATATLALIDGDATYAAGTWTIADGDEATFALDVAFDGTDGAGTYRVTLDTIAGVEVDETSTGMTLTSS